MAINDISVDQNKRNIASQIEGGRKGFENVVGSTKFSSFNGKDFAGMDQNGIETFKQANWRFEQSVRQIISGLDTKIPPTLAFKGPAATAVTEFLKSVKGLLYTYVDAISLEGNEVEEAYNRWYKAAGELQASVTSDAEATDGVKAKINLE